MIIEKQLIDSALDGIDLVCSDLEVLRLKAVINMDLDDYTNVFAAFKGAESLKEQIKEAQAAIERALTKKQSMIKRMEVVENE